jgi:adenylate cyclase
LAFHTASVFNIDWDRGLVSDTSGNQTALRAQSLAVLKALHDRAGSLVSKGELLDKIWPGVAVTDDSLVQCIAELRRAFKDDSHMVIKTLPKRGYIFESNIVSSFDTTSNAPSYATTLETLGRTIQVVEPNAQEYSIAVLPFANMSGDAGQEYFTDGLTEDIITELSNTAGLFIIARNSCFAYKGKVQDVRQIAHDLGVRYIVEGSVRKSAQRLRITVQVNDTKVGKQIWAERFDRELADIFAVQDEVASRIVQSFVGKINSSAKIERYHPADLNAYDLVVKSRNQWFVSKAANDEARSHLERAVVLDPNYCEALRLLARVLLSTWLLWGESQEPNRSAALAMAQRAVAADPQDSDARSTLGFILLNERRWDESEAQYNISLQLNPNNADTYILLADFFVVNGNPKQAIEAGAMALRLNPRPHGNYFWVIGYAQVADGKYDNAVVTLSRQETYRTASRRLLAAALALIGRTSDAREEAKHFMATSPHWRISKWIEYQPFKNPRDAQFWHDAYLLAGLPE